LAVDSEDSNNSEHNVKLDESPRPENNYESKINLLDREKENQSDAKYFTQLKSNRQVN
jgi:hypothetical protein